MFHTLCDADDGVCVCVQKSQRHLRTKTSYKDSYEYDWESNPDLEIYSAVLPTNLPWHPVITGRNLWCDW